MKPAKKYKQKYGVFSAGGVFCYETNDFKEAKQHCKFLKMANRNIDYLVWCMTPVFEAKGAT